MKISNVPKAFAMMVVASGVAASSPRTSTAAELLQPDTEFLKNVGAWGIGQANWDSGELAAMTFPNAYRFTRAYRITYGPDAAAPAPLKHAEKPLDLTALTAYAADGVQTVETILRDRLKNHALVIIKGDTILHEHYWNGMTPESTHQDMSVTKSFTSILAAIAATEGAIDMNAPVTRYLPEFKGTAFEETTIQHVADMRSGLDIKTPPNKTWDPKFTESQEWNGPNDSGLNGIAEYLATIKATKYPTGEVYQYQDPNTEVLGLIVERATKANLADYFEQKIWRRFGSEGDAYWQADPTGFVVASGGLNMRTRDLARFGMVMVNAGKSHDGSQIVPKAFIDALMAGNDEVRAAWAKGEESALVANGWYKDQIRTLVLGEHKVMAFVGIHGQVLIMEPSSKTVMAFNGGYPQTVTPRMAILIFHQVVPTLLDAIAGGD